MKRLIFLLLALLVAGSAGAATKVQVMTDGVIDTDRLKTIPLLYETDPEAPVLGQVWWNNATNQLKVAGALGVYAFNSTSLVEWDTTPEAFSFTDVANATTSTVYTSDPITVSGINWPAAISVSGDASAKYSINNATAVSTNGVVESGDTVSAVVTSSASDATAVNATVVIGGVSDAYSVTTAGSESVTYLIDEDFEGTGTPSGWWIDGGAGTTMNYDATDVVLSGTQSAKLTSSGAYGDLSSPEFTQQTTLLTVDVKFLSTYDTSSIGSAHKIIDLISGDGSSVASIATTSAGELGVSFAGELKSTWDLVISADTNYELRIQYAADDGGDSWAKVYQKADNSWVLRGEWSKTGTSPAAARISFKKPGISGSFYYDDVAVY